MKKRMFFLLFLSILFAFNLEVLAFTGDYNYEVKTLSKDASGNITVTGWAIPNAGVDDGASPSLNINRGSGSGNNCSGKSTNYYTYTLYAVPLDSNSQFKSDLSDAILIGSKRGSGTDLTPIMCYTIDGGCDASKSSCYKNVGWSFTFDESILNTSNFSNGYVLFLRIVASGDDKNPIHFPLIVYEDRISGFGNDYTYSDGSQIGVSMKVKVIVYDGYFQTCSNGSCQRLNKNQFPHGNEYTVYGTTVNNANNLTYYKINNTTLYIPASWVAPPSNYAVLFPPVDEAKDVSSCSENEQGQTPSEKEINACSGDANFSGENYSSCTVDKYSYYTKKCYENNYNASLKINNLENSVNDFFITNGAGFEATAKLSTDFICQYTFDIENFLSDYNDVLYNLDFYNENTADWYFNYNIKQNLDNILANYIAQTGQANNWDSKYDFTKLIATLKVGSDSVNLVYDEEDFLHDTIDLNNDGRKENNYCLVSNTRTINLNGLQYTINTDLRCGESYEMSLHLPRVCFNMKNGEVENCNPSANNQLDGGYKYYIDLNSASGDIELNLQNLGYDGNFELTLKDCMYKVPSENDSQIKFRQIDLLDPFNQNYGTNREIGSNYLNANYNFVNILKSDIWEQNYAYQYSLSKVNIDSIRKDTAEEGVSSYNGRNCYFTSTNKYICDFTREDNNLFSKVEINN